MSSPEALETKAVACNFTDGTSACSMGAKAYILDGNQGNANESIRILARSRSGRWIDVWVRPETMRNYWVVTVVSDNHAVFDALTRLSKEPWIAGLHMLVTTDAWCTYMNKSIEQHESVTGGL